MYSGALRPMTSKNVSDMVMEDDDSDIEREVNRGKRSKTSKTAPKRLKPNIAENEAWDYPDVLSKQMSLPQDMCRRVVHLLDNDNTIPFIARYRKEQTGNMDASKLREFNECYNDLKEVRSKVSKAINTLSTKGQMTPSLSSSFRLVTSLEEFEHLYQPLKTSKTTLAERARQAGLQPAAQSLLDQPNQFSFSELCKYVNQSVKGLEKVAAVEEGVQHIIADIIAKDSDILKFVQEKFIPSKLKLESKASRCLKKKNDNKKDSCDAHKFENYYNFRKTASEMESHQVLAINRGESLKILTIKIDIPDYLSADYSHFAYRHVCKSTSVVNSYAKKILNASVTESYTRFVQPLVGRRTRSHLTKTAEKSAVGVFVKNLKNLLLTPPVRGKIVLGIDPGFTKGCKIAVISPLGEIMHTSTLFLHVQPSSLKEQAKLISIINESRCDIIGIGNGTACRETEAIISRMINEKQVHLPNLAFCIVNESGISIYSVSDDAALELPHLDPNLRSAVSLARRVVDPLSEYVKVEPKHLGVGMYQHDVSENILKRNLESTIEECVSDVGVDLNTCTVAVLSKVAGLSKIKAKNILDWRQANGTFVNREQLQLIPGIGPKTYEQCAGFLRIEANSSISSVNPRGVKKAPRTNVKKTKDKLVTVDVKCNLLDRTIVHPESYPLVYKLLTIVGLEGRDIGSPEFIRTVKMSLVPERVQELAVKLKVGQLTLNLIVEGLQKCLDFDIRSENKGPLFKTCIRDMESLYPNLTLTGKVMNVTDFGAFIDVGVGKSGLVHRSQMKLGKQSIVLSVGDVVEVQVLNVDIQKGRIGLRLVSMS